MRLSPYPMALATAFCLLGCLIVTAVFAAKITRDQPSASRPLPSDSPISIGEWNVAASNASAAGLRPEPDCTPHGNGLRHIVGSQAFPTLNQIPWDQLRPDDVVCLPYRSEPYRHKIHFMARGAEGHPIRLVGLRGPNGERPVIDGNGATTSSRVAASDGNSDRQHVGLITLQGRAPRENDTQGAWQPGHITIVGLKIQNARGSYQFTSSDGTPQHYDEFAAGIHIDSADNIIIEDCEITDNAIGIFAGSHDGARGPADRASQHLTIRGSDIHDNGDPLNRGHHNVYIEAHGCNVIGNFLGLSQEHLGANYKSRCTEEHFYANYLRGSKGALLMFAPPLADLDPLNLLPDAQNAVVAGNVFDMRASDATLPSPPIRLGDIDSPAPGRYRGRIFVVDNTVLTNGYDLLDVLDDSERRQAGRSVDLVLTNNLVIDSDEHPSLVYGGRDAGAARGRARHFDNPSIPRSLAAHAQWPRMTSSEIPTIRLPPATHSSVNQANTAHAVAMYEFVDTEHGPWFRLRASQGQALASGASGMP
jgi:hypothetical protein